MLSWNTTDAKLKFEKQVVGDARTIIEVGATAGRDTKGFLEEFPNAHIYSFEPSPESYQKLKELEEIYPRLIAIPSAVLDYTGEVEFNIANRPGSCSTLVPNDWDEVYIETTISVPVTTIDTFCQAQSITHIDFLKVDTEGTDLKVLEGTFTMLSQRAIDVVEAEFNFKHYFKDQCAHYDIIKFLAGYGMRLVAVFPQYWKGRLTYADGIFIRDTVEK